MNLYHQELIEHYHHPRHRGTLPSPDVASTVHNPSCGDTVSWQICIQKGRIAAIAFQGTGCVISQAAASMLAEYCLGTELEVVCAYTTQTMLNLIGMELGPTRLKCALLPLEALHNALATYKP